MADAWALQFDGVNDNITLATPLNLPSVNDQSFVYVWDFFYDGTSDQVLFANPASFNDSVRISNSSTIIFRGGSSSATFNLTTPLTTGRQILKFKKSGFSCTFYDADNNALAPIETRAIQNTIYGFGAESVSSRKFSGILYNAKVYNDFDETDLVIELKNTISGTETVFPDIVGTNKATLNNFPTDGSQWILYGDGGATSNDVTATASVEISKPTFSVAATKTSPSYVSNIAFSISVPIFNANAVSSAPSYDATASFEVVKPTFNATATNVTPPISVNAAFDIDKPVFNATSLNIAPSGSAVVSFNVSKPAFAAIALNSKPIYESIINLTLNKPTFTISATSELPNDSAVIQFEIDKPTFNVIASNTIPLQVASVALSIYRPLFSISASHFNQGDYRPPADLITGKLTNTLITSPLKTTLITGKLEY